MMLSPEAYAHLTDVKYMRGKGQKEIRDAFLERFPCGKADTRAVMRWLAEDTNGPSYFFNGFIGVSNVHHEVYEAVEQAVRDAFTSIATSVPIEED